MQTRPSLTNRPASSHDRRDDRGSCSHRYHVLYPVDEHHHDGFSALIDTAHARLLRRSCADAGICVRVNVRVRGLAP